MKLKIFGEQEQKKEDPVYLRLENDGDNISLIATDEDGYRHGAGHLLRLTKDGKIQLSVCVNKELGFQLSRGGKIEIN